MASRSYSSCERQNLHFQSQVLATIMHRCRDPPCHVAVCPKQLTPELRATAYLAAAGGLTLGWL